MFLFFPKSFQRHHSVEALDGDQVAAEVLYDREDHRARDSDVAFELRSEDHLVVAQ